MEFYESTEKMVVAANYHSIAAGRGTYCFRKRFSHSSFCLHFVLNSNEKDSIRSRISQKKHKLRAVK